MANPGGARCLKRYEKLGQNIICGVRPNIQLSRSFSSKPIGQHLPIPNAKVLSTVTKQNLPCRAALTPSSRRRYASRSDSEIKKTPLYDLHASKKAKFVPFGGYSMPLYYDDLSHVESHHWTREKASIFDVSHMYEHVSCLSPLLILSSGYSTNYPVHQPKHS
jgi:Aminomethyltransferase folate-binding domain